MNILVIGSGGREHALVKKIALSPKNPKVYALPGNPGMREATLVPGNPMDNEQTVKTALELKIDFAVVAPDDPLANGLVDALEAAGIPCFGPNQKAAELESSKVFSKDLMERYQIPTARFKAFTQVTPAFEYLKNHPLPVVIKADGLAKGKGVVIACSREEAEDAVCAMLLDKTFGDSGSRIIIEEYLEGPEVSVLTLTDGQTLLALPSAMDHKRAGDNDTGLNTGGMGVIAPNPFYTADVHKRAMEEIFLPTLKALKAEGRPFSGCIFFGLMLTQDGPKVLEYNARFGDPETQAVLELVEGDLLSALMACREGTLRPDMLKPTGEHACCVVLASKGYPGSFQTGYLIFVGEAVKDRVHFAGVKALESGLVTSGGRVLSVTCTGKTLKEAITSAYDAARQVDFTGKYCRFDIGASAL